MSIERTPCPLCGSESADFRMSTRDRLCGVAGEFALVRCRDCGLTYLNPRPDAQSIDTYYPPAYDPHRIERLEDLPPLKRLTVRYGLRKRCSAVLRWKRRGRVLDVGCATGLFLAEMQKVRGWEAYGVEPGEAAAAVAARVHGLPIHVGDLASAHYADATFDAVTLWDVLEHLHDPVAVLREVRRLLKPDGVLVMRTPTLESWDARVFGKYWAGLDSPRHLAIFTRGTMARLLGQSGFTMERLSTGTGSYIIFLLSLGFWLDERAPDVRLRKALRRLFDNPVSRALALAPFALADRLGYGAAMTVVARPVPASRETEVSA